MREDWVSDELGNLFHTTSGGTPSRRNDDYYKGSILWVKSGELDKGVIFDTEEKISEDAIKNSSAKIFPKGTLLIALYGATIGKLAFLGVDAATNQAICGIFKNENIDSKFLYNFLLFSRRKLISQGTGGAQPNISQTILKKLEFPFPSKPEQRAIVLTIENLFASLDKGIADLKTAQQQLKVYRQAVLKKAFEGKLTNSLNFISSDSHRHELRMVAEVASKYNTKRNHDNQKNQGSNNLPEGWKWVKLRKIATKITDGEHFRPKTIETGVFFISAKDVKENGVDFSNPLYISRETAEKALKRCNPEKGDILIVSRGATVGRMCIVNTDKIFCLLGSVILIKVNKDINSLYLVYFLKSPLANQVLVGLSGSTAQQAIYLRDIQNVETLIPSTPSEQHAIVREIESRLSVCDKVEQSISEALEKAEALRQSILKKAFDGKLLSEAEIAKCKQEADYEPASELLKKIKAEKK